MADTNSVKAARLEIVGDREVRTAWSARRISVWLNQLRSWGGAMKRLILVDALLLVMAASNRAMAAGPQAWVDGWPGAWASSGNCDPYVDYNCAPPKTPVRALKGEPCDPYVNP
jgi:hypothetical protein